MISFSFAGGLDSRALEAEFEREELRPANCENCSNLKNGTYCTRYCATIYEHERPVGCRGYREREARQ